MPEADQTYEAVEILHYWDGPTEFIAVKNWDAPVEYYYGVTEDLYPTDEHGQDVERAYLMWSLPPKSSEPDFVLAESGIDWSEAGGRP